MMPVQTIPAGYEAVIPYLVVRDAAAAMEFYRTVFAATEVLRLADDQGRVNHAEMRVGKGMLMLAEESNEHPGPQTVGSCPITLMLYVEEVDKTFAAAVNAGGIVKRPLADQFYGDRGGSFADPFGYTWWLATHKEDVSEAEMQKRMNALSAS
jgi:PhnB protein